MGNDDFKILIEAILDKTKSKANINSDIQNLQNTVDKLKLGAQLDSNSIKNLTKQIQGIVNQNIRLQNVDIDTSKIKQSGQQITKILSQAQVELNTERAETSLKALSARAQKLNVDLNLSNVNSALDAAKVQMTSESFKKVDLEVQKLRKDLTGLNMSNITKPITELQRVNLSTKMQKWLDLNTAASKKFSVRIRELIEQCAILDGSDFYKLEARFKSVISKAAAAGKVGKSFGDTMHAGIQKFTEWGMASRIVMGVVQSFKDMVSNVYTLDDSLLELSKVSDLSANGLKNVTEEAYKLGETVGKTGTQTLDAITAAKRAGYGLKESMSLAEDALKLTNVAEGIDDAGTAMESLIHILKGSGKDSSYAGNVLDMINEVSNTQSVNFDNLVDGGERLSAVATQAGMSLEQMFGVLTGGYEVLGNMEKVASGGITILTRLQSIQLPDEEDVLPVAKLQEKINAATNGVVNVVDESTGQLRDAYSILDDINGVWDTLDKNTQEGIAFAAGGTRQKAVFLSWMQNWDNVKKSVESATNSMGSADIENEKYLNSLSGKTAQFQSAFEHLSKTVLDSDMLKFFVDLGTTGVSVIDNLVEALTPLGTIGLVGGGILGAKNLGSCKNACVTILYAERHNVLMGDCEFCMTLCETYA